MSTPDPGHVFRGYLSTNLRSQVVLRDGGHCRYCARKAWDIQIDHVIPVAHGGLTELDNLVVACKRCNQEKGTELWQPMTLQAMWTLKRKKVAGAKATRAKKKANGTWVERPRQKRP